MLEKNILIPTCKLKIEKDISTIYLTTVAHFCNMALEMIDSVHQTLDATDPACDISLCDASLSNDQSLVAERDTSNYPAVSDNSNIRRFTQLFETNDSHNASQSSLNIAA